MELNPPSEEDTKTDQKPELMQVDSEVQPSPQEGQETKEPAALDHKEKESEETRKDLDSLDTKKEEEKKEEEDDLTGFSPLRD